MIYRAYSFRLKPTVQQALALEKQASVNRLVYNLALEQRRDWWRQYQRATGHNLNWVAQCKQLTELRSEFDFIKMGSQTSQQNEIKCLDDAFKAFFKLGSGFPKFRKKGIGDRIFAHGRSVRIKAINKKYSFVSMPKIGFLKFRKTRIIKGDVFEATVYRDANGWSISIGCKIKSDIKNVGGAVGVDRGVAIPLMLSDGQQLTLPDGMRCVEKLKIRAQKNASRRKRGSKRHALAQLRVSKLSARIARIRKDWAHRSTTAISRQYGTVVVERLRTKNMTKRAHENGVAQKRGLNRAILNVGWHQIETMLAYKVYRLVKVDPSYSSQTCSSCGTVDKQSRKNQASFVCTACGYRDNADRNAAAVILQRGNTALLDVEGGGCVPVEASTALGQPHKRGC